jgi:hypothetical protein
MARGNAKLSAGSPLLEAVRGSDADGPLVSLVLSTYGLGLDPPFFENDFLPAVLGIGGVRDGGYASPLTLERRLADTYCGLVVDAHAIAEGGRPSLQIEVVPIGHRTNHAKIVLLHRKRRIRLVVASANLTHPGYRLQREVGALLDFTPEGGLSGHTLHAAMESWLEVLGEAATDSLRAAVLAAAAQAIKWAPSSTKGSPEVIWGGTPDSLWRRFADAWPSGEPVTDWAVCSPFWPEPGGETPFEAIASELSRKRVDLRQSALHVFACADSMGDRARPVFPIHLVRHLKKHGFSVGSGKILPVRREALAHELVEAGALEERELHAKWVLLQGPRTCILLAGSANFTRKGLGVLEKSESANIEAGVLLRRSVADFSLSNVAPPIVERGIVDWNSCDATNLADGPVDEVDPPLPWPDWIARIEVFVDWLAVGEPTGSLRIVSRPTVSHREFEIVCPATKETAETMLIRVPAATRAGPSSPTNVPLDGATLRHLLVSRAVSVRWGGSTAIYPVNIEASSRVGLPRVLAVHPDEEQLLAYFHGRIAEEDLARMLADPAIVERRKASQSDPASIDRLRALQNYLMREFVESLFGLRQLLTEAVMRSPRAFEQALLGEFSPLTLVSEVVKAAQSGRRSPTAAAFQLVELLSLILNLEIPPVNADNEDRALEKIRERAVLAILKSATLAAGTASMQAAFTERNFTTYARSVLGTSGFTRWRAAVGKSTAVTVS